MPVAAIVGTLVVFGLGFVVGRGSAGDGAGGGGLAEDAVGGAPTILVQALNTCDLGVSNAGVGVGDDGYSLDLDGHGGESVGLSGED